MSVFKDLLATLLIGALFGAAVIFLSSQAGHPIPEPDDRPVFFIGSILLALCFRLLFIFREEDS